MSAYDVSTFADWKPNDIPTGVVGLDAGNSVLYETGGWRSRRPIWDAEKCKHCLQCWPYCPDSSILTEDSKVIGISLDHCKGCGLCARECKHDAITMISETEAKEA